LMHAMKSIPKKAADKTNCGFASRTEKRKLHMITLPKRSPSKHAAMAVLAAAISMASTSVQAQDAGEPTPVPTSTEGRLTGMIIGGAISVPEYEGSSDMTVVPLIAGEVRWGNNRYAAWDGISGRINFLDNERFEFGPALNITLGRDKDIESLQIRKLGEIDTAVELGAFAAFNIPSGFRDGDMIRFSGQVLSDVSDVHEGVIGELAASYRTRIGTRLNLTTYGSFSFANDEYADTYFSIKPPGALATGLKATTVEAGAKDFSFGVTATYDLTDRWSLFAMTEYNRLLGDFADSPIVAVAGDDNQFSVGLGIGWKF
jgi:MipA family protein